MINYSLAFEDFLIDINLSNCANKNFHFAIRPSKVEFSNRYLRGVICSEGKHVMPEHLRNPN